MNSLIANVYFTLYDKCQSNGLQIGSSTLKTQSNCYFSLLLGVKSDIMSSQQPFNVISNDQQSSSLHCSSRGRDLQIIGPSANGEVQHIQKLSDHIGALFLNDEYSDVSLVVEGQSFRAHKVILAARSGTQCRIILLFPYSFLTTEGGK